MNSLFHRQPGLAEAARSLDRYGVPQDLRERFVAYVANAKRAALWHANPRYLAEQLESSEPAALRLLLAAVHEGLVRLHWDVQCPKCGAITHRSDTLTELHREGECAVCHLVFPQRLDVEVRVTFSVELPRQPLSPADDDPVWRKSIDDRWGPVSGQRLLVLPEFQKLFPREKLLPSESLEVARAAFVFTDLTGSTALYAARGDPHAFHLVRLHFDSLFEAADKHGGTIVKNIGDAVMAVFRTPVEALGAGLAMLDAMAELNARLRLESADQLILKVGVHSGPCLNVTLNERPDYFGTTVNVAARVQSLAKGNDVVFTDAIYENEAARALLPMPPAESWRTTLKGVDGEVQVYRVVVDQAKSRDDGK